MWRDIARSLPIGAKRRTSCCANDASAVVSKSIHGLHFYCHRCGEKGFEPVGQWSISDILAARQATAEARDTTSAGKAYEEAEELREDALIPREVFVWGLKAAITPERASRLGWRWSEKLQRLLIPVSGAFLARSLDPRIKPKYILLGSNTSVVYTTGPQEPDTDKPHVLVEDVLSAIRIGDAGYGASAIIGTSITSEIAASLSRHPRIAVWLDPDGAGDRGFVKVKKALALYPVELSKVRHSFRVDPKYLTTEQIRSTLC